MIADTLRVKFLILLVGVALVALSGTLVFRSLVLGDFRDFLEGDTEDKAYAILANVEGAYEQDSGWNTDKQSQLAIWCLTLGFAMRVYDGEGRLVVSTEKAADRAPSALKRRIASLSHPRDRGGSGSFAPYPLFLEGKQIGTLELLPLRENKESLYVKRADLFMLISVFVVGGLALLMSILFSGRLVRPINELSLAASAISRGGPGRRVTVSRRDELGRLGLSFNRMAEDLEAQESLRRKLVADVAHELRTPLGIMRGEIEAMIDGMMAVDEKRLQSLYDETSRLKRMVEGIEDLNQAERSVLYLKRQRFPLKPFLSDIVDRFRVIAGPGKTISLECPESLEADADPERLGQVMVNLVSNAVRAVLRGGEVSLTAEKAANGVLIVVKDNGTGIRQEDLPFVFERFYRGPDGGLGIGLTIVKELIEAHGGSVTVESVQGEGSTFRVLLPVRGVHNSS